MDINVAEYSSNLSSPGDIPVFFLAARVSTCLLQLYALHTLPSSCKKCPSRHLELRTGKYSFFFQIISVPSASSRFLVNFPRPKKRHEGRVTGCANSVLGPLVSSAEEHSSVHIKRRYLIRCSMVPKGWTCSHRLRMPYVLLLQRNVHANVHTKAVASVNSRVCTCVARRASYHVKSVVGKIGGW